MKSELTPTRAIPCVVSRQSLVPRTQVPDAATIRKNYKWLAMKLHPDKYFNKSKEEREEASERMKDVNNARDFLENRPPMEFEPDTPGRAPAPQPAPQYQGQYQEGRKSHGMTLYYVYMVKAKSSANQQRRYFGSTCVGRYKRLAQHVNRSEKGASFLKSCVPKSFKIFVTSDWMSKAKARKWELLSVLDEFYKVYLEYMDRGPWWITCAGFSSRSWSAVVALSIEKHV